MNAKEYMARNGRDACEVVANRAGTSLGYYLQIVYGVRRPSVELAEKLVEASDGELDFVSLMKGKKRLRDAS